ncbi:MAG: 50S ribosomal protein L29 [Omnitrophica bacterium RBG_13_46_9]|nr:MAG: 50S ribosomal protein L29 [Omnitrophica bacterium RBG_13_46_9]
MKTKPIDIRNMTREEIKSKVLALKEAMFKLRCEQKSGRVEKPHRIKEARRDLARCFTILKEKENTEKRNGQR